MAIGIMDSGIGGLSVLREIRTLLPAEDVIFAADQAHVPYGPRTLEEVRTFTTGVVRFLIGQGVKIVVIGCNAASAGALYHVREQFPEMPFVGMEPAVKPAAQNTQTGVIGVIATKATFQGELYASVVGRFAQGVRVETQACPDFVLLAEAGETDTPAVYAAVRHYLTPLLETGIDQLVLGCTHFPFLKPAIQAVIGPGVTIVDPSLAVAQQARRVLEARGALQNGTGPGHTIYYTSGDPAKFRVVLHALLGADADPAADVRSARWDSAGQRLER